MGAILMGVCIGNKKDANIVGPLFDGMVLLSRYHKVGDSTFMKLSDMVPAAPGWHRALQRPQYAGVVILASI